MPMCMYLCKLIKCQYVYGTNAFSAENPGSQVHAACRKLVQAQSQKFRNQIICKNGKSFFYFITVQNTILYFACFCNVKCFLKINQKIFRKILFFWFVICARYCRTLFGLLKGQFYHQGGPIIMVQVRNSKLDSSPVSQRRPSKQRGLA